MHNRHARPPVSRLLLSLLASCTVIPAIGQSNSLEQPTSGVQSEGSLQFTGDTGRISLGLVNGGHFQGELSGVLSERANAAWLGEGWLQGSAGGVQLGYHQLDGEAIQKYFIALDQNDKSDRKLTLGAGIERSNWFGNGYISRGLGDRRLIDQSSVSAVTQQTGTEGDRPFVDTLTRITTTQIFERAYDYGIGLRAGHYYDESHLRLTAGLDYEWGQGNARQSNLSLLAEKYFVGTPHSVALQLDQYHKSGDAEIVRNDTRVLVSYRYSFGASNSQPQRMYRMVASAPPPVVTPPVAEPTVVPAHNERKVIKTKATMSGDAFFEISSAALTPVARSELDRIATLLKTTPHEGNAHIVGHTCDLGSDAFNMALSVKRANAVRDYLVAAGALAADAVVVEGKGKSEPKFAVTAATRFKNRRVDLEFVSIVEKETVVEVPEQIIAAPAAAVTPVPPVTYEREEVQQEPAWLRRALRTPAVHKRTVDVYRMKEVSQTESTSRTWVNRAPVAKDDAFAVVTGSTTVLAVLGNDSDPDTGDTIGLASVSAPAKGQAKLEAGQIVYVAAADFVGQDTFTYVIKDSKGAGSTATVVVNVAQANRAPVAQSDSYSVVAGSSTSMPVLGNDTDADAGDTLSLVSVSAPTSGQARIEGGQVVYVAAANFVGQDSFTYVVKDSKGATSNATVTVNVTPANRAPVAQADSYNVVAGSTTSMPVLANDTDADAGDTLSLVSVSAPTGGQARIEGGQVVYVASANFVGQDSFTYVVKDSKGATATATVTVSVASANHAPVARDDSYIVSSGRPSNLQVLSNDTDADGDALSITSVSQPIGGNGTVAVVGSNIVFTPKNGFIYDTFTYTISDGKGGQATATVQLIDP